MFFYSEAYWTCPEGWHCLSKSDLKMIIEHSDILSSVSNKKINNITLLAPLSEV